MCSLKNNGASQISTDRAGVVSGDANQFKMQITLIIIIGN